MTLPLNLYLIWTRIQNMKMTHLCQCLTCHLRPSQNSCLKSQTLSSGYSSCFLLRSASNKIVLDWIDMFLYDAGLLIQRMLSNYSWSNLDVNWSSVKRKHYHSLQHQHQLWWCLHMPHPVLVHFHLLLFMLHKLPHHPPHLHLLMCHKKHPNHHIRQLRALCLEPFTEVLLLDNHHLWRWICHEPFLCCFFSVLTVNFIFLFVGWRQG